MSTRPPKPVGKRSAGLLMYRRLAAGSLELFLAHPGGPFFLHKDLGAWTIPKGELAAGEEPLACALREFEEETGMRPEAAEYRSLGAIRQRAGKVVEAWAFEGSFEGRTLQSNTFELEWPPRSGQRKAFPEVDRVAFFGVEEARAKILPAQAELIDRLLALVGG